MATISNIIKSKTSTSAILDGIQFNSITHTGFGEQVLWVKGSNIWQTSADSATDIPFAVNGVDINWNSAEWPNDIGNYVPTTINTTGDLLKAIKYASTHGGSTLSPATSTVLGGIKTGFTQSDQNKNYPVKLDSNNNAYVNVPWINTEYNDGNLIDIDNKNINHGIPTNIDDPDNANVDDVPYGDPDGDNGEITLLASITRDKYGHIVNAQTITITQLKSLLGLLTFLIQQSEIENNSITLTAYINNDTGEDSLADDTIWRCQNNNIKAYDKDNANYNFNNPTASYKLTIQRDFEHDTEYSYDPSVNGDDICSLIYDGEDAFNTENNYLSTNASDPTYDFVYKKDGAISYWLPIDEHFKLTIQKKWQSKNIDVTALNTNMPDLSEEQINFDLPSYMYNVLSDFAHTSIIGIDKSDEISSHLDITTTYFDVNDYDSRKQGFIITNNYAGDEDLTGYLTVKIGWDINNFGYTTYTKDFKYYIGLLHRPLYTITWNYNGGKVGNNTSTSSQQRADTTLSLPAQNPTYIVNITWNTQGGTLLENDGTQSITRTFNNWFTASTGGTQVNAQTIVSKTVIYYAHWSKPNTAVLLPTTDPTRDNYTFDGWFTASTGGTQVPDDELYPTTDVTYYAHWSPNLVTYKWYIGTTQPTAVDNPSEWRTSNTDAGFTETVTLSEGITWFAYPDTWAYTAKDSSGDDFAFNAFVPAATKTSISGYILLKMSLGASETVKITFSK